MAIKTIYHCDHCGAETEYVKLPPFWVIAEIRDSDSDLQRIYSKYWCNCCWDEIQREKPKLAGK